MNTRKHALSTSPKRQTVKHVPFKDQTSKRKSL